MRKRTLAHSLIVVCVVWSTGHRALSQALKADSSVPAPDIPAAIYLPIHCDSSGDIIVQPPLAKINPEGKRIGLFDLAAAATDGFTDLTPKAYAVADDGGVFQIARTKDQSVVVVKFEGDGRYKGTVKLDGKFEPEQLGVFKDEAFLASGVTLSTGGESPEFSTYMALFDRSGRFLKQIDSGEPSYLPRSGQKTENPTSQGGGSDPKSAAPAEHLSAPPELSIVESDGVYVYLLRQGTTPTVFVISPAGILDRKLTLSPPEAGTTVSALRVGVGKLLVEYTRSNALPNGNAAYYLSLYDSLEGKTLSEYTRGPSIEGTLGCTDWKGNFSFVAADMQGSRVLLKARIE